MDWKVNASANTDGADILSGAFRFDIDAFGDAEFNEITPEIVFNQHVACGDVTR